jgi:arylsulfatase A-like enzyme
VPVVVIVADGARPDTLAGAMSRGILPAMSALRDEGGMHTITSVFPSVTGPAYAAFVMGRYPGPVGLPGLRWYDRERRTCRLPGNSRSYVGAELRLVDRDIDPAAPTIFELVPSSVSALSPISRGLAPGRRVGTGLRFVLGTARTHFTGNVKGWLSLDRDIADEVGRRIETSHPDFVFAALTGIDKTSHSAGHLGPEVDEAMRIVDDLVARVRRDAEKRGTWDKTHLWVVSDHGHSRVVEHEDLAGFVRQLGFRTIAHPFVYSMRGEVAVMVSGNAMAHIYVDLPRRTRPWAAGVGGRWSVIRQALLGRDSVDLVLLPSGPGECEVHGSRGRGAARLSWANGRISYRPESGDPIAVGSHENLTDDEAYDVTLASDYPDSFVQIANLSDSPRSGDIILSASRDWDFRAKYEPIPHSSSHGALHRDHMIVPLVTSKPVKSRPRRTADIMPSALTALGIAVPHGLDGKSFL